MIIVASLPLNVPKDLELQRPGRSPVTVRAGDYVAIPAAQANAKADPREFGLWPASEAPAFLQTAKIANVFVELSSDGWSLTAT